MVPGGTLWHRADCPLVAGKPQAVPVDSRVMMIGDLGPCPICEPSAGHGPSAADKPLTADGPFTADGPSATDDSAAADPGD